jgi:uncharacterized membrane protein
MMVSLVLASLFFVAIHVFVSGTGLRDAVVAKLGERPYLGLFSLASLAGIVWMAWSYNRAPYLELWGSPAALRHLAALLLIPATFLVVAGLTTRNPTAVGADKAAAQAPVGVVKLTRHPFLWGVAIWALAHMLANGDVASLVFFGSFFALAHVGPRLIDAKRARKDPQAWASFAAQTSATPFRGPLRPSLGEIGWWRIGLSAVVYLALLLWLHEAVLGVSPMAA